MTRRIARTSRRSTATGSGARAATGRRVSIASVAAVDLVVEADHLVGELVVAAREGVQRRAERAQDEVAFRLECGLELSSSSWKDDSQPKRPGDVALGALVGGLGEDLLGRVVLDEDPVAAAVVLDLEAEERGHLGDARCLLHVVRDDHERVLAS